MKLHNASFAAITCYFNPCGYRNRERNFLRFAAELERQQVPLWVVEATVPGQQPLIPPGAMRIHVQLNENRWLWQKERLLNNLLQALPPTITKVAWVDCDLLFANDEWPKLASDALDTWPVIQLFDFAYWLGSRGERLPWEREMDRRASLASIAMHYPERAQDFRLGTPGFAWAARREILSRHKFYENDITGGNDTMMAAGFFGWRDHGFVATGSKAMIHDGLNYIDAMYKEVRGFVGYIPCNISHLWHGSHANRAYESKRSALRDLGFDPFRDIETDEATGLLRITRYANPRLTSYLQSLFYGRREDDLD